MAGGGVLGRPRIGRGGRFVVDRLMDGDEDVVGKKRRFMEWLHSSIDDEILPEDAVHWIREDYDAEEETAVVGRFGIIED